MLPSLTSHRSLHQSVGGTSVWPAAHLNAPPPPKMWLRFTGGRRNSLPERQGVRAGTPFASSEEQGLATWQLTLRGTVSTGAPWGRGTSPLPSMARLLSPRTFEPRHWVQRGASQAGARPASQAVPAGMRSRRRGRARGGGAGRPRKAAAPGLAHLSPPLAARHGPLAPGGRPGRQHLPGSQQPPRGPEEAAAAAGGAAAGAGSTARGACQ